MYESIHEPIQVFAEFTEKGPKPYLFKWKNRSYKITAVNFIHTSKEGSKSLFHFSVSADTNTYKLTFDPATLVWTLDEIFMDADKPNNRYS